MRNENKIIEQYRVKIGMLGTNSEHGNNGMFIIPFKKKQFKVIVSDQLNWDHVSVSYASGLKRCPTWDEMCFIKDLFFEKDECVVQFHPAEKDYVNNHEYCLHLWKYQLKDFYKPEKFMV